MGQGSSSLPSSLPNYALHCLRVAPSSPASGQIEPFFDYLVGVETDPPSELIPEDGLSPVELGRVLEENEGRRILLKIYNAKSQRIRDVQLVPSRTWVEEALRANGEEPSKDQDRDQDRKEDRKPSLLGLSLRVCNPARALESVYHVLDVLEGSPAEMAGLVPWGDFVIAWSGGPLHSENDFYSLIENHVDKPLRLFVYNSDLDNLREVVLYPTRQWGGEGLIGCGIGYGLLHRIPRPPTPPTTVFSADGYFSPDVNTVSDKTETGASEGTTAVNPEKEGGQGELYVPANIASPPSAASPAHA